MKELHPDGLTAELSHGFGELNRMARRRTGQVNSDVDYLPMLAVYAVFKLHYRHRRLWNGIDSKHGTSTSDEGLLVDSAPGYAMSEDEG